MLCVARMNRYLCWVQCLLCLAVCLLPDQCLTGATESSTVCKPTGNCTCSSYGENGLMRVDCSHQQLNTVPANALLPKNTDYLDLKMNNIRQLAKLEKSTDLKHLVLATNDLELVDNFAFEHTAELIYIDLSFNQLKTLPETLFDNLTELQYLNLSHNHIEFLPKTIFKKCKLLSELHLSYNPLKQIDLDTFFYLQDLQVLDLAHNEIFSLESGTFNSMTKLDTLDLSGNDFDGVPTNALRAARSLLSLDLSSNPIKVINEASFYKMHSLKELKLNHMKRLVEVKKKAFSSLFNLQTLSMEDNPHLTFIDSYAFSGTFNHSWIAIKHVSLRRNSLSKLAEGTLPFCNLTTLDLTENPWRCDCHLHWIKYCEEQHKKDFHRGIICTYPENLRGKELEMLSHHSLVCDKSNSLQQSSLLFTISLFFMFLMFATLIVFIYRDRFIGYNNRKQGSIYYVRAQSETE